MTYKAATDRPRVAEVIERLGKCLELVPLDPHFHDISVGLYLKDGICTIWTYSCIPGVENRIANIRDQFVSIGDLEPVAGSHDQIRFSCGHIHLRALKFLLAQAVGKSPDFSPPTGDLSIQDTRTKLMLSVAGSQSGGKWVYQVSGAGEAPSIPARLRLVVAGFVRYGEMEKESDTEVSFPCRQRHDRLMRLLLPYSRNVSAVESMIDADAMRGQMTTGTLGFTPT
ncbi:MAG: hypothetical protein IH962_04965 [Chloroflexi bacterium]|nr:hypothetical protein [Chloroflexota bacterium]